jgi:hypothetical protein
MTRILRGRQLDRVDLIVDAIYSGSKTKRGGLTDPLVRLVGVSRQGGFRYRGNWRAPTLIVLTSTLVEPDWPDELDLTTGQLVYFGDNRQPGTTLHQTPRRGNLLLRQVFDLLHLERRAEIPPILVFTAEGIGRTFRFRGLAVPGHIGVAETQDLMAVWKTAGNERFQNYRAVFTILNAPSVSRTWLRGRTPQHAPNAWTRWVEDGIYSPLLAPRTTQIRSRHEQLPTSKQDEILLSMVRAHYSDNAFAFEICAAEIARMALGHVSSLHLTRPYRDGGRDGIGSLQVGQTVGSIDISFALEAKCYSMRNSVGVREVSRLISRIKHREFGILVTTSYVGDQAYREVIDDGHPIVLITGRDVVELLRREGVSTQAKLRQWLRRIDVLIAHGTLTPSAHHSRPAPDPASRDDGRRRRRSRRPSPPLPAVRR